MQDANGKIKAEGTGTVTMEPTARTRENRIQGSCLGINKGEGATRMFKKMRSCKGIETEVLNRINTTKTKEERKKEILNYRCTKRKKYPKVDGWLS
jgi:hypothetical protein